MILVLINVLSYLPLVIPSGVLDFDLQACGTDKILIKWDAPNEVKYPDINHYDIFWRLPGFSETVKSVKKHAGTYNETIDGLQSGATYEFRIAAVAANGSTVRCSVTKLQRTDRRHTLNNLCRESTHL